MRLYLFLYLVLSLGTPVLQARDLPSLIASPTLRTYAETDLQKHPENQLLWQYRILASALHQGKFQTAELLIDDAIYRLQRLAEDPKRHHATWWGRERNKTFIGDAHERALLYFYRGILYWRKGDTDNARACFRALLVEDMQVPGGNSGDWILGEYLDGLLAHRQGYTQYANEAYQRAQTHWNNTHPHHPFPFHAYSKKTNVHIFFTGGNPVTKTLKGTHHQNPSYKRKKDPRRLSGMLLRSDHSTIAAPFADDLLRQAQTHTSLMDTLRERQTQNKTAYAEGSKTLYATAAALGTFSPEAGQLLIGLGTLAQLRSSFTRPEADPRFWDNAPSRIGYLSTYLPPGQHQVDLGFTRHNHLHPKFSWQDQRLTIPLKGEVILFLHDQLPFSP